ncbi:MAG TPA: hypothetical protein VHV08_05135, partial [Pirellulales bacterium]|nr:hypothetical protein [Pirellulales bacterium]
LNCLQRGQVGLAKLYLLLLGFRLLVESRGAVGSFLAGNLLALPIVLKITPLMIVGYVMVEQFVSAWRSPVRSQAMVRAANLAAGTACGLVLGVLLIPAMFVGWQANLDHLETWRRVMANAQNSADDGLAGDNYSVRNQSLDNAVRRFGNWADYCFAGGPFDEGGPPDAYGYRGLIMDRPLTQHVLSVVRLLEGCLMLAVAYRVGRNGGPMGHALVFGLACASTLVLGPIARGHYFMLQLPAVMYVGTWLAVRQRPIMARAAALIPTALIMAHFILLGFAGRIGLLGIGTAVWFTWAALSVLWLTRQAASCGDEHDRRPDADVSTPHAFAIHHRRQHGATH